MCGKRLKVQKRSKRLVKASCSWFSLSATPNNSPSALVCHSYIIFSPKHNNKPPIRHPLLTHPPYPLTVRATPVDQLLVAQLVRRRDVNDLRRFARRLRDGVDSGETLEHQLALQLAEPLLVDVEPDLERPLAQLESIILDRRLVLRLQVI